MATPLTESHRSEPPLPPRPRSLHVGRCALLKVSAIVGCGTIGLFAQSHVAPKLLGSVGHIPGGLLTAFGVAYDLRPLDLRRLVWALLLGGEMRDPGCSLPHELILSTGVNGRRTWGKDEAVMPLTASRPEPASPPAPGSPSARPPAPVSPPPATSG